jgi:membrane protein DedA with SNARE-associated domain/rhodanese-related sulfurtransferase
MDLTVTQILHFVERDGYALLFWWVLAEQGALPIPSVPLLIAVGAVIHMGGLSLGPAMVFCAAGALIADSVWFFLGRSRGKSVLKFFCRVSLEPDSCVRQTESAFVKYGVKTLLVAKFVPGLNAVAAPLAGDSRISFAKFLAIDALGTMIWSGTFMGAGYIFSDQLELLLSRLQQMGSGFAAVLFGSFGSWILWKFFQRRRFLRQIEGARIAPEELHDRMEAGEDLFIVDLRNHSGKELNPIPNAMRISVTELTANPQLVPVDREVILFCSCPNDATSARMALLLQSKGIANVRPLRGGADAWDKVVQSRGLSPNLEVQPE